MPYNSTLKICSIIKFVICFICFKFFNAVEVLVWSVSTPTHSQNISKTYHNTVSIKMIINIDKNHAILLLLTVLHLRQLHKKTAWRTKHFPIGSMGQKQEILLVLCQCQKHHVFKNEMWKKEEIMTHNGMCVVLPYLKSTPIV